MYHTGFLDPPLGIHWLTQPEAFHLRFAPAVFHDLEHFLNQNSLSSPFHKNKSSNLEFTTAI